MTVTLPPMMPVEIGQHAPRRALVVWRGVSAEDASGAPWWWRWLLRPLLRPGFLHVFVYLEAGAVVVGVDPLMPGTVVTVEVGATLESIREAYALPEVRDAMAITGLRLVEDLPARPDAGLPWLAWTPITCVQEVARLIGVRTGFAATPWRLWNVLSGSGQ